MGRTLFLLIIGLGGAAILLSLGVWQVQRLAWKEAIIADIETRIAAEPVALPDTPDPARDAYLPVRVTGQMGAESLRVLVSQKQVGAGYRVISPLETPSGPIMVDRGFVPVDREIPAPPAEPVTVTGNLQWPEETDGFTPAPDAARNIWYARDVAAMAEALGTRPVLVVARDAPEAGGALQPLPVDTARIPNDHLQYAITWFSLAAVWLLMTATFLLRRRSQPAES